MTLRLVGKSTRRVLIHLVPQETLDEALSDDALADQVAKDCGDRMHDPSWCPICDARRDGIEAYRTAVYQAVLKERSP